MKRSKLALCAVMLVATLTAALALAATEIGQAAPAFTLKDQSGKEVKLADLKDKIVVLEWFNPGCPVTQRHHSDKTPTMRTLANGYKDKGVVWLGVCTGNGATAETVTKMKVPYQVLNDSAGAAAKAFGARTTPHMFIIDAKGNLAYNGAIDDDAAGSSANPTNYVAKALDELLAGKTVTTSQTKPYGCGVRVP